MEPRLRLANVCKSFVLHLQGGTELPVFDNVNLELNAGECVVLTGRSGVGKSTLLRLIYGNYRCPDGSIDILHNDERVDIASAPPHRVIDVRRHTLGYVSQFLRVIPRVPALEVVAEPLYRLGVDHGVAEDKARALLQRLRSPESLWPLPPMTFSGGEQQRINIARGFMIDYPILLLDEPTASLDAENRATVVEMINERRKAGTAILGIFHDADVRNAVATRLIDIANYRAAA
jgi:alpha-D-ribose 1-methylphosphonate 5-triphosphate synthase subunit PhnL